MVLNLTDDECIIMGRSAGHVLSSSDDAMPRASITSSRRVARIHEPPKSGAGSDLCVASDAQAM